MTVYKAIAEDIERKIREGAYQPGDKLPSERALSEIYRVSRMTVRHSLAELERLGAVLKEQGRGTFVSRPHLVQKNLANFTETLKIRGMEPSSKVLEFSTVHHLAAISAKLGLPEETRYYKLKRIRQGDGIPIALETAYLPAGLFPGLKDYDMSQSLYNVIEKAYGFVIDTLSCEMEAIVSNRGVAAMMALPKQEALLKVATVAYDRGGACLYYEEAYYRSGIYKYSVDIKR